MIRELGEIQHWQRPTKVPGVPLGGPPARKLRANLMRKGGEPAAAGGAASSPGARKRLHDGAHLHRHRRLGGRGW